MDHPGNWSERKVGEVRSQNARADREGLKTATFEEHGEKGWKLAESHPCFAYGVSIVRQAHRVAALPAEDEEAALVAAKAAHVEAVLELGHRPEVAEGLGVSAARLTRAAVAVIRERGSLNAGTLH